MTDRSLTEKIEELYELYKSGALTEDEYNSLKSQMIDSLGDQQLTTPKIVSTPSSTEEKNGETNTIERSESKNEIKPEKSDKLYIGSKKGGRLFQYLTVLILISIVIFAVVLINSNKSLMNSNESSKPKTIKKDNKGWDEEVATSIILNELSEFPDWTKIANGNSHEWTHEIVRFEKMRLNKRELMIVLVNNKFKFGRQLSIFEFEHKRKWNLTNKSIAFSQGEFSTSPNENYLYQIAVDNYGVILKDIYGIRNANVIEKFLYAFVKGEFKEIFSAHATVSQTDSNPDFRIKLIANGDGYYDIESLDDGKGHVYERDKTFLYKFNGNEYVTANLDTSSEKQSSVDRSSNFSETILSVLKSYYYDFNNNTKDFDASKFFADNVEKYITFKNTSAEAISNYMQTDFIKEFINPSFGFEPESFSVTQQGDSYVAEYIEASNCFRKSRQKSQKVRVHVKAIFDSSFKITYFSQYDLIENIFY